MVALRKDPMLPHPFQVQQVRQETYDTVTLTLEPENERDTIKFTPGQFNMVYIFGVGEIPLSVSGDAAHPETLVHTVRSLGKVTQAMCNLKRGDTVGVRGPFGSHWPVKEIEGNDVVIVAGGVGLAPLRPAIYAILDNREKYGHIALLYGARSPRDLLFQPELEKWRARFDIQVEVSVDAALGNWHGNVGVITTLIPRAVFDQQQAVALVCGPEVMMRFSQIELEKRGIGPERVYFSMERSMECAIGLCGHCQYGPMFICKDGPVYRFDHIKDWFGRREI